MDGCTGLSLIGHPSHLRPVVDVSQVVHEITPYENAGLCLRLQQHLLLHLPSALAQWQGSVDSAQRSFQDQAKSMGDQFTLVSCLFDVHCHEVIDSMLYS